MAIDGRSKGTPALGVHVQNHGFRDVAFSKFCFSIEIEGVETRLMTLEPLSSATFPHTLKPGANFDMLALQSFFVAEMRKLNPPPGARIRAVVADQLSRQFKGKWENMPDYVRPSR